LSIIFSFRKYVVELQGLGSLLMNVSLCPIE